MNSRHLAAVLMLLLIGISCFLSTPVLSGEHPWDVDRTDGNSGSGGGRSVAAPADSGRDQVTGSIASVKEPTSSHNYGSWYGLISRLVVHYSTHTATTRVHGVNAKGKAER